MERRSRSLAFEAPHLAGRAYDPTNLHPLDAEDRRHDDTTTDIDWDEIIATTQDDELAGRYCFTTEHYATHEEGMAALKDWLRRTIEEALNETPSALATDAPR